MPIEAALQCFAAELQVLQRDGGLLVAHKMEHDAGVLECELRRANMPEAALLLAQLATAGVCTMQAAAAQARSRDRPPRSVMQLRMSFNHGLFAIGLLKASRMYGIGRPAETTESRQHTAAYDADLAGRLYFAMRGIGYGTPPVQITAANESLMRFQAGESIQQIAAVGPSGKAIAPKTVVNYILAELKQGQPVDLVRFKRQCAEIGCAPPSETEWKQLLTAFNQSMSRADVPQTHLELLVTFLPEAAKPRVERTAAEQATMISWHQKAAWFLALHHVGRQPSFE